MALFWRIWAALSLVAFAVLAFFIVLATLQFANINSTLVGERLTVLGERTAGPFISAAKIGLPLSSVRNADALLERARLTDDAILSLHVFDPAGNVVHSTAAPAPLQIPPTAMAARAAATDGTWYSETAETFLGGIEITVGNANAGGILIEYPSNYHSLGIRAMSAELAIAALFALVVVAGVGFLILRQALNRQVLLFDAIDNAIADFERGAWRSAARVSSKVDAIDPQELRGLLEGAEIEYRRLGRLLEDSEASKP
jgi:hypothetical protein